MADATSTLVDSLPSQTTLLVGNLPPQIDEEFLKSHFSVVLNTDVNSVDMLHDKNTGAFRNAAYVNVGSQEKVHRALRELNDSVLQGKRIIVSLAISPYTSPLRKSIFLKNLPKHYNAMILYDKLKKYGQIVAIKLPHHNANQTGQNYAFASFLTEEDAQNAIHGINTESHATNRILAVPCQSGGARDARAKSEGGDEKRGANNADTDAPDAQSSGEGVKAPLDRLTVDIDSSSASLGQTMVDPELGYGVAPSSPSAEGPEGRFTEAAHDLRHQLGIDSMTSLVRRKQALRDHLYPLHADKYADKPLRELLGVLVRSLDVDTLLELAVDENKFRMYAKDAMKALDVGEHLIHPLSNEALELRHELNLDAMANDRARKACIRGYLRKQHCEDEHSFEYLDMVLDVLLNSFDVNGLLELAVDEKQFDMYALDAKDAIAADSERVQSLPDLAIELRNQLGLDGMTSVGERKTAIGNYLFLKYQHEYTKCRILLSYILGVIIGSLSVNELLILAVDQRRFRRYADDAKELLRLERIRTFQSSEAALSLADWLDLDTKHTASEQKEAVSEHLGKLYKDEIPPIPDLQRILSVLRRSLDLKELLELAIDDDMFRAYAKDAKEALDAGEYVVHPLSREALELRRILLLDVLRSYADRKKEIYRYLQEVYKDKYSPPTVLNRILSVLMDSFEVNDLLEIAADEKKFHLYAKPHRTSME